MKKIYIRLLMLSLHFTFFVCSAQVQNSNPFLSVGPEVSWDIRGNYKLGTGGSVKFGLPITQRTALTFSGGVVSFPGKTFEFQGTKVYNLSMAMLPVKAGFRYNLNKGVYLEPQVGYSRIMLENTPAIRVPDFGALSYALNIGVIKNKHWDISAQYQGFTNKNKYAVNFHSIGTRIAYNFNFKK